MKNIGQISRMLAILLTSVAVLGLIFWRFVLPESEPVALLVSTQPASPQPVVTAQNSAAVAPVVAPVTEPVAAPVAESATESAEDSHGHDEQNHDEQMEPPSPAIVDAIREMKKPTPDEGQMIQNPDGSMKLKLGNRLQSVPVATIGKDGKVHVDYHGEKYLQDDKKPEEQKQETPTP